MRCLFRRKKAAIAAIATTTPAIPTPIPIFAPFPNPSVVTEITEADGLGVVDAGSMSVADVVGFVRGVVEVGVEAEVDEDVFELVDENPIVAAMTIPCFRLQHVTLTPPQHHDPSLHWPTATLSVASPPFLYNQ